MSQVPRRGGDALVWHLPGLERDPSAGPWHRGRTPAGHQFRAPAMESGEASLVAEEVCSAALQARRDRGVSEVAHRAGEAARALADAETAAGRQARERLGLELGWPEPLAGETLQRMARGWAPTTLMGLVRRELGDPAVLDGFVADPAAGDGPAGGAVPAGGDEPADGTPRGGGRRRTAAGPPLLLQVQSGNVPGVGITGILRALMVGSGVLVKSSRQCPGLAAAFARSLARRDPVLGRSVAVTWWPGGERPPEARTWAKRAGKAVVYGGEEAISGLRDLLPVECDLVRYGPKLGVGIVLRDADLPEAARSLSRDVCAYEQRGCLSPRLVFTVGEERREPFARLMAEALGDEVEASGRATLSAAEASAIRNLRAEVELGGHGVEARVVGPPGELGWTVLTAPRPRIETEALPRVVRIYRVPDVEGWARLLRPLEGRIQAVGYAGEAELDELARRSALLGACRIAPFGTVAWPPPDWMHDGRGQLAPLLRWTELEGPT